MNNLAEYQLIWFVLFIFSYSSYNLQKENPIHLFYLEPDTDQSLHKDFQKVNPVSLFYQEPDADQSLHKDFLQVSLPAAMEADYLYHILHE